MDTDSIRLIIDDACPGAWNMSVDQAILESVEETAVPVLRIYRWAPATLSLGYFQKFEDRQLHTQSTNCDLVRRASGGGAILHDLEITYSLAFPSTNRWADRNTEVYRLVHGTISQVLSGYSITTWPFDPEQHPAPENPNSFLCFQRRSEGDLICDGHKVVGSAQRRSKNAVLQHGSILLQTSRFAPQLPGIFEISGIEFDLDNFRDQLIEQICVSLELRSFKSELSPREQKIAESYKQTRFGNDDWNIRREKNRLTE